MHALDLNKLAFMQVHGEITAYGTWLRTDDGWRPALVLIRTGDEGKEACVPCVVTMDKLWVWTEEVGDEEIAGQMCANFFDPLRLEVGADSAFKILSVIRFHIGDVFSIPPMPTSDLSVVGDILKTNRLTGEVTGVEIVDHV